VNPSNQLPQGGRHYRQLGGMVSVQCQSVLAAGMLCPPRLQSGMGWRSGGAGAGDQEHGTEKTLGQVLPKAAHQSSGLQALSVAAIRRV
jgi:hypothetical protein